MFADDDYTPPSMKPTGKANKKKKDGKQKNQVQFSERAASFNMAVPSRI